MFQKENADTRGSGDPGVTTSPGSLSDADSSDSGGGASGTGTDEPDTSSVFVDVCKRILCIRIILAYIVHDVFDEFANIDPWIIAQHYILDVLRAGETPTDAVGQRIFGMSSEDLLDEWGIIYDIRFLLRLPGKKKNRFIIACLEFQNDCCEYGSALKCGSYYSACLMSGQEGTVFRGQNCGNICKVCSIWICPIPPRRHACSLNCYRVAEEKKSGCSEQDPEDYDVFSMAMICLGEKDDNGNPPAVKTLSLLQTIFSREISADKKSSILKEKFNIQLTDEQKEDVRAMNAILEACKAEGNAEGEVRGILLMCRKIHATRDEAARQLMDLLQMSEEDVQDALDNFGYDR